MSALSTVALTARSLLWVVLLPGVVAGYIPWRYFGVGSSGVQGRNAGDLLGLLVAIAGVILLGACVVEFARTGRGTLSPVDPPRRLVVRGLYRYVRNPMYLGVLLVLAGEALLARSTPLLAYAAGCFVAFNLFIVLYEEPALRHAYGSDYEAYKRAVRRWLPRRPRQSQPE